MIEFEKFTEEEISNALLLIIQEIEEKNELISTPQIMADCKDLGQDWINTGFQVLLDKHYITANKELDSCFYNCKLTQTAIDYLNGKDVLTLTETANLVLEKSYEWYIRNSYVMDTQENSNIISYALGIRNHEKIRNAIMSLIDKGFLHKGVVMRDFTIFCITTDGVTFVENQHKQVNKTEKSPSQIVINENSGNIAISSENVTQIVNSNELNQAFERLENLIKEKLEDSQKQDALEKVEMAKELSKTQHPKWNLVKKILDHLGTIPVICEGVKAVIDLVSQFQ